MEQVFYDNFDPKMPHQWTACGGKQFRIKVNNDTLSGARMIVSDLPLDEKTIRQLADM